MREKRVGDLTKENEKKKKTERSQSHVLKRKEERVLVVHKKTLGNESVRMALLWLFKWFLQIKAGAHSIFKHLSLDLS